MAVTIPLFTPKAPVVYFYNVEYHLAEMDDVTFQHFYDRVLDNSIDFDLRVEEMPAFQYADQKGWIQLQQAKNAYNVELCEVEDKKRVMARAA